MQKRKYYLNVIQDSLANGTSIIFRSTDRIEFYNYIKLITQKYIPYKGLFKVTKYSDKTIVSFCDNGKIFSSWYMSKPTGKVDDVYFVRLDKLISLL